MKKIFFTMLILLKILCLFGCGSEKKNREYDTILKKIEAEQKIEEEILNQINNEINDEIGKRIIEKHINMETNQNLDISGSSVTIKKFLLGGKIHMVGESIFKGKVKNKSGYFAYTIELESDNKQNLKEPTSWELSKLIIKESGKTKRFFISGKEIMEIGDQITIDGIKITLNRDNGLAQTFTTSSRLTKEQIMKLKDNRERKKRKIITLFIKGEKLEYARYDDGLGLFMYSPDRIYEINKEGDKYKFKQVKY